MAAREQQRQPGVRVITSRHSLPSEWDRRHWGGRHQHVQEYLKVDGLTVKYVGPGESDAQAATICADHPVPADVPLFYYEVTIVNQGDNGYIGIGFCTDSVNLGRLPGWEPHSYGYHGDDGHAFHGSGQGRAFGPGFGSGDVVGALLDRGRNTISYYKNGQPVGVAFYGVKEQQLYPCVGMRTRHEEVRANFGASPFAADLDKLHTEFRDRVLADILAVPLPATAELQPLPPQPPPQQQQQQPGDAQAQAAPASGTQAPPSSSGVDTMAAQFAAWLVEQQGGGRAAAAQAGAAGAGAAAAAAAAAAGGAEGGAAAAQPPAQAAAEGRAGVGKGASQPLMPFLIFNYLLHRRCWKTAAVVARDMLAAEGGGADAAAAAGDGGAGAAAAAPGDAAAAAAAAAAADGGAGAGGGAAGDAANGAAAPTAAAAADDHPMPDAGGGSAGGAAAASAGTPSPQQQQQQQQQQQPAATATLPGQPAGGSSSSGGAGQRAALAAMGGLSQADIQDALVRQQIYDTVCAGRVAEALALTWAHYGPGVLDGAPRLSFKLRVQQFVELVRQASSSSGAGGDGVAAGQPPPQQQQQQQVSNGSVGGAASFEAALAYGRSELGPGSKAPADEELLSDALSLLAYADPAASPCGHLLREASRAELAEELNGALLKARGSSGRPLLESAYRQAVVLVEELKRLGLPAALVLDVPGLCCEPPPAAPGAAQGGSATVMQQ